MDSTTKDQRAIDRVVEMLGDSRSILFITGAGLSADSGLPTYRGTGGLYDIDTTEDDIPIERVLAGDFFLEHPEVTWKYLAQIERACRGAECNPGHRVIAEMEGHFERVWTLTQNVDGLHRAAGARNVIDIHGDLHDLRCTKCLHRRSVKDYSELEVPPRCPKCPSPLRPDVVLFGETLAEEKLLVLLSELDRGFDMVLTIGTSSLFAYVAEPVYLAARRGACTVEINPSSTPVSKLVDIKLPMRAAPALDAIWQRYREHFE